MTGKQWETKPFRLLDQKQYAEYRERLAAVNKLLKDGRINRRDHSFRVREITKDVGKQIIRFVRAKDIRPNPNEWLALDDETINAYRRDRNREGVNLFDKKYGLVTDPKLLRKWFAALPPDVVSIIPCHFIKGTGGVDAFGHGQCFRIPYKHSIGDVVPKALKPDASDLADAVFGRAAERASRVFFEDATPVEPIKTLEPTTIHPLMQPNPTSYQLYLDQSNQDDLNHWDSPQSRLRGCKFYWHNANENWHATPQELALDQGKTDDKKLTRTLEPMARGSRFKSKIRFENLSEIELGALLTVFDLDGASSAAYKLGKGKPFGFGSVRIQSKLSVEREDAYDQFFNAEGWIDPLRADESTQKYLDAFKNYVAERGLLDQWSDVMRELKTILDWDQTKRPDWNARVEMMRGTFVKDRNGNEQFKLDERFKQRAILPNIFEVVK